MTNTVRSVPSHVDAGYRLDNSMLLKTVALYNNSTRNVVGVDRDNIPVRLSGKSHDQSTDDTVTVVMKYTYHNYHEFMENVTVLIAFENKQPRCINKTHEVIRNVFYRYKNLPPAAGPITLCIRFDIPTKTIVDNGAIYDSASNYLIVDATHWGKFVHPDSPEYRENHPVQKYTVEKCASGIIVEIVDNERTISDRFFYAGNDVIKVSPRVDTTRDEGVYVTRITNERDGGEKYEQQYFSFEDATKAVGLYRTREEAITDGSPEALVRHQDEAFQQLKREFAAKELKLREENAALDARHRQEERESQAQFLALKQLLEQDQILSNTEHKKELQRIERESREREEEAKRREAKFKKKVTKAEKKLKETEQHLKEKASKQALKARKLADKLAKESLQTKEEYARRAQELALHAKSREDYYDQRSHERKDSSEFIKWLPAIFTGGLAIFSIFRSA